MVEISSTLGCDNDIICHVECPHQDDCANHKSALDMRTECGPRPKLSTQEGKIYCSTFNNKYFMAAQYGAFTKEQLQ